ncbi:hypothetical protein SAMN05216267_10011, partial [Actinacidiphila rubida]
CSRSSSRPWRCRFVGGVRGHSGSVSSNCACTVLPCPYPGGCTVLRGHTRIVPFRPVPVCGRALAVSHVPRRTVDQREGVGRKCSPQRNVRGPRATTRTNPYAHFRGDASGPPPTPVPTARISGARGTARTTTTARHTATHRKGQDEPRRGAGSPSLRPGGAPNASNPPPAGGRRRTARGRTSPAGARGPPAFGREVPPTRATHHRPVDGDAPQGAGGNPTPQTPGARPDARCARTTEGGPMDRHRTPEA